MEIIEETSGPEMCCMVVHYIIIVLAKYLQMMVAYHIHRKQPESVANDFKRFNQSYEKLLLDFTDVTGEIFKPGNISDLNNALFLE